MNKVLLGGWVAVEPKQRFTKKGTAVCNLVLRVPNREGVMEFITVTAWEDQAVDVAGLQAGAEVSVRARYRERMIDGRPVGSLIMVGLGNGDAQGDFEDV